MMPWLYFSQSFCEKQKPLFWMPQDNFLFRLQVGFYLATSSLMTSHRGDPWKNSKTRSLRTHSKIAARRSNSETRSDILWFFRFVFHNANWKLFSTLTANHPTYFHACRSRTEQYKLDFRSIQSLLYAR